MACNRWSVGSCLCVLSALISVPASSADLLETFRNAQLRDPTHLSALASYRASQEWVPQARAGLLPNMGFSAQQMNNRLDKTDGGVGLPQQSYLSNNRTLSVRQALLRPLAFAQLEQAQFQAAGALHDLQRAQNELAVRIASTYMDALYAQDQAEAARSQASLLKVQHDAAVRQFQQGYGIRADVDEAQARLGQAEAELQQLQSARIYALEQLSWFAGVSDPAPLQWETGGFLRKPDQPTLAQWIERGEQANPDVLFGRMKSQAAQVEIKKSTAGHLPTVDLLVQVSDSRNENIQFPTISYLNKQIGVQLTVPIFSGGGTQSLVRQAEEQAQQEEYLLNATMVNARLQITREYANVKDGCTKIVAGIHSVQAARQTFIATEKNLEAGYRTRLDVFNAIDRIASTSKDLMLSRYQTVLAWIKLQLLSGTPADKAITNMQEHCSLNHSSAENISLGI